ncbi:MAG TPA: biotin/lipoyl-containing protein [Ktedonobacterales bacterium]
MLYIATIGGRQHIVEVEANGRVRRVVVDGRALAVDCRLVGEAGAHAASRDEQLADHYSLLAGNDSYEAFARLVPSAGEGGERTVEVHIHGRPYVVTLQDEREQALANLAGAARVSGDVAVRAPMPGLVVNVMVQPGEEVRRGQTVVVLEAMKMENDLQAPRAGIVKEVRVGKGQTVKQDAVLAVVGDVGGEIESAADEDDAGA